MSAYPIRAIVKKHMFLLCSTTLLLLLLLTGGGLVSHYFTDMTYIQNIPNKNSTPFLLWRLALYTVIIMGWQPFVCTVFRNHDSTEQRKKRDYLLGYKKKIILYIILYEALVSQSAISHILGWLV